MNIDQNQIDVLLQKYDELYALNPELYDLFKQNVDFMDEKIPTAIPFQQNQRHYSQATSIARHLQRKGFFENQTTILEAGSGTGQLGLTIACLLTPNLQVYADELARVNSSSTKKNTIPQNIRPKSSMYLVDLKQGLKYKNDRYFCFTDFHAVRLIGNLIGVNRQTIQTHNVKREQNQTLNIDSLINEQTVLINKLTVVGKHLCGAATDIVLVYEGVDQFGIALCCHAKCDAQLYVNKEYLHGMDMQFMFKLTSYQHCYGKQELNAEQTLRKELGFKARQMLDVGRILYLKSKGYTVGLVKYCSDEESGEAWLLWAKK
ncbi:Methyltransferase_TRM13 [Hexamita inflata]|uniref:tRNA:m(4)X modification enzyme TRM13 n=1 Tax=Hexamita inflata TaxID=28002 RepID=A0AA86QRF3_9EUKA|nr:Methyltransferase TRM13 [Hexamita inflata]